MKDKIKDFVKEHKEAVTVVASIGVAYAIGYKMGKNVEACKIQEGLERCFKINPELEPMMWQTVWKMNGHWNG